MKIFPNRYSKHSAFTLVEIVIVVFIIMVLSVLVLANYEWGGHQLSLKRSAHKVARDLRKAEDLAMSTAETNGGAPRGGYGISFSLSEPHSYVLFGDNNGDSSYNPNPPANDLIIEEVELEENIVISELYWSSGVLMGDSLDIVFTPPDPIVTMPSDSTSSIVTLHSVKTNQTIKIYINKVGLIEVGE